MAISGKIFVFEHRLDPLRPRTRQAVYKDIKRAAAAFRVPINVAPHSARKIYAVAEYKKDMNVKRVQELLNHSSEAVTMIYILADALTERNQQKKHR
jgi:integrase